MTYDSNAVETPVEASLRARNCLVRLFLLDLANGIGDLLYGTPGARANRAEGRTVPIPWTRPISYGTASEAAWMNRLFTIGLYAAGIGALGFVIRFYILNEDIQMRRDASRFGQLTKSSGPRDQVRPPTPKN